MLTSICNYARIIEAVRANNSTFFYYVLFYTGTEKAEHKDLGVSYLVIVCVLLGYMDFFLKNQRYYISWVVQTVRVLILLLFWVFYMPFFETFVTVFRCEDGRHSIDRSTICYSGSHVLHCIVSVFAIVLLFAMNLITAMLFNETQPVKDDALSR